MCQNVDAAVKPIYKHQYSFLELEKKYLDNQNILLNMYVVVSDMHYIRCYSEVPGWIVSCTEQELNMGLRIMDCFEFQSFYKLDGMTEYSGLHLKKSCT